MTSKSEVVITCYNMSMFFICKVVIICYYDPLWEPQALHLQICKFFMGSLMLICPRINDGHPMVSESCANLPREYNLIISDPSPDHDSHMITATNMILPGTL